MVTAREEERLERFSFIIEGPPVSVNAKDKQTKKYQKWIRSVREAARQSWPLSTRLLRSGVEVTVEITNFHTLPALDVANVIKPVLDGLRDAVYQDDQQVQKVISQREKIIDLFNPEPEVIVAAGKYSEFLFVVVT